MDQLGHVNNVTYVDKRSWYKEIGQGMGAALNTAAASGAYVLSDRGTWIAFKNKADLAIVVEGDRLRSGAFASC